MDVIEAVRWLDLDAKRVLVGHIQVVVQGLVGSGMGAGPSLALLLSGPALSLPIIIVINSILGPKKTVAYIPLVIIMAAI